MNFHFYVNYPFNHLTYHARYYLMSSLYLLLYLEHLGFYGGTVVEHSGSRHAHIKPGPNLNLAQS